MIDVKSIEKMLNKIKDIDLKIRTDYKIDNHSVPRVTTVLSSMMHEDGLMSWANSLGFRRINYRGYLTEAANKGTYSHLAIERFLKYNEIPAMFDERYPINIAPIVQSTFSAFYKWWEMLNRNHKVELVFSEEKLTHPYFGGTCDCVLKIDGRYWLIDFKTSNHMNYKYTLQLGAYKYLLRHCKDIELGGCIVLILDKSTKNYYEYALDFSIKEHKDYIELCTETFLVLAVAYRLRVLGQKEYKSIFDNIV